MEHIDAIRRYIDAHRQEMLDLWRDLVNTESGPAQKEGVGAVCRRLCAELEAMRVHTRPVPMEDGSQVLVADWDNGGEEAPVLLIGHMDTVFQPGAATKNPFRIDPDGTAHGPGVLDMKAGLVIALYAVKALQSVGWAGRNVRFLFAGDEETAHKNSDAKAVMAREARGCAAAFNFETGYLDDGIVVGRRGAAIVNFHIAGVSAHSGIEPEKGRSAILEASHRIIALEALNDLPRSKLINCGLITGGESSNTVPDSCTITASLRFPTIAIKEELLEDCRRIMEAPSTVPDTTATMRVGGVFDPMEHTQGVQKLYELVEETAREIGYGPVHPFEVSGASDSAISVNEGVPTVCAMGVRGAFNHTEREYAVVESLFQRTLLAAACIIRVQEKPCREG